MPHSTGHIRSFVKNVLFQYSATIALMGFEFLFIVVVSRHLGKKQFGMMSFGYSFSFIIFQLLDFRITDVIVRFLAQFMQEGDRKKQVAFMHLALFCELFRAVLVLLLCALVSLVVVPFFWESRYVEVILLSSVFLFFNNVATSTARGVLRLLDKFHVAAYISVIAVMLKLLFGWLLIVNGAGTLTNILYATIAAYIISSALFILAINHWTRKALGFGIVLREFRPLAQFRQLGSEMRTILDFTKHMYVGSLSMVPTKELDINVLGWFTTMEVVGVYKVAKNFMSALWSFIDSVFLVCYPQMARLIQQREHHQLKKFTSSLTLVMGLAGVGLYLSGIVAAPVLISYMMGEQYREAGPLFAVMFSGVLVWSPLLWLNPYAMSATRSDIMSRSAMIASVLIMAAYPFAAILDAARGVAWVTALTSPLTAAVVWYFLYRSYLLPMEPEDERWASALTGCRQYRQ